MQTSGTKQIPLTFHFHRKADGRYSVKSPDVPGLWLASKNLAILQSDLNIVVRDLLYFNLDIVVDGDIQWKPNTAAAFAAVESLVPAKDNPAAADVTGRVTVKAA
jgi:hypothetical protein